MSNQTTTTNNSLDHTTSQKDDQEKPPEPYYVNAKQYVRIIKRRYSRNQLNQILNKIKEYEHTTVNKNKKYLHESRHKHAMKRARGPGGRFLTAEELAKK